MRSRWKLFHVRVIHGSHTLYDSHPASFVPVLLDNRPRWNHRILRHHHDSVADVVIRRIDLNASVPCW